VGSEVVPAHIVGDDQDDVGPLGSFGVTVAAGHAQDRQNQYADHRHVNEPHPGVSSDRASLSRIIE
jgi:hypothetical protein